MEINSFGAVMKFALDLENILLDQLKTSAPNENEKIKQCQKNIQFLERTRRENINETILQPITGLNETDYVFNSSSSIENSSGKITKFYTDAADKLSIDEAKRLFRQLAKKRASERATGFASASERGLGGNGEV